MKNNDTAPGSHQYQTLNLENFDFEMKSQNAESDYNVGDENILTLD